MKLHSNIEITRNDTRVVAIPVEDGDAGGYRENLQDVDILYHITTRRGGGEVVIELTDDDPEITVVDVGDMDSEALESIPDDTDIIRIELSPDDTGNLEDRRYFHECEVTDQAGNEVTIMQGRVETFDSST